MDNGDLCFICLETCKNPGKLDLNCECNYIVHKKCFNKWHRMHKTCIICHENCNPIKEPGIVILRDNIINIRITHNAYDGLIFWCLLFLFLRILSLFNERIPKNKLTMEN